MAIIANFIGIDKHLDPKIRDLTGARRDATALWALFADSVDGMWATLLVDAVATLDRIRQILDETLGAASEDDVVILTFSGHVRTITAWSRTTHRLTISTERHCPWTSSQKNFAPRERGPSFAFSIAASAGERPHAFSKTVL